MSGRADSLDWLSGGYSRWALLVGGSLLLLLAVVGVAHGFRASMSYAGYHSVRYGSQAKQPDAMVVAKICRRANRYYPHNYFMNIMAGEKCWYAEANGTVTREALVEEARWWCDEGLSQNYFSSQLRKLKTNLLELESPVAAADYWEEYVDWDFWNPDHHADLVRLQVKAGDFDKAARSLLWVEGEPRYAEASAYLREAWKGEQEPPPMP